MCVKLFAVRGYATTQSFVQFHNQIRPNDIVILGYEHYSVRVATGYGLPHTIEVAQQPSL